MEYKLKFDIKTDWSKLIFKEITEKRSLIFKTLYNDISNSKKRLII